MANPTALPQALLGWQFFRDINSELCNFIERSDVPLGPAATQTVLILCATQTNLPQVMGGPRYQDLLRPWIAGMLANPEGAADRAQALAAFIVEDQQQPLTRSARLAAAFPLDGGEAAVDAILAEGNAGNSLLTAYLLSLLASLFQDRPSPSDLRR